MVCQKKEKSEVIFSQNQFYFFFHVSTNSLSFRFLPPPFQRKEIGMISKVTRNLEIFRFFSLLQKMKSGAQLVRRKKEKSAAILVTIIVVFFMCHVHRLVPRVMSLHEKSVFLAREMVAFVLIRTKFDSYPNNAFLSTNWYFD